LIFNKHCRMPICLDIQHILSWYSLTISVLVKYCPFAYITKCCLFALIYQFKLPTLALILAKHFSFPLTLHKNCHFCLTLYNIANLPWSLIIIFYLPIFIDFTKNAYLPWLFIHSDRFPWSSINLFALIFNKPVCLDLQ